MYRSRLANAVLSFLSADDKKHRVCRSTFAAEISGLNGSLERGRVIQMAFEECFTGPINAQKALNMEDGETGSKESAFTTHLESAIDAKPVFTAVEAPETKTPAEASLLGSIQGVREKNTVSDRRT